MTVSDGSISNVRHDLLTPINHLLGYSEIILETCVDLGLEELASHLQKIRSESKDLIDAIYRALPSTPQPGVGIDLASLNVVLREPIEHIFQAIEAAERAITTAADADVTEDMVKIRTAAVRLNGQVQSLAGSPETEPPQAPVNGALSRTPPATALSVRVAAPHPETQAGGLILVVDDDAANRDMLSKRLQREGYQTVIAQEGLEALQRLSEQAFDLVLLDFMMPGMSGSEALKAIKSTPATAHIPVIMISAMNDSEKVVNCIALGAEDYLPKPFDPVLLRARVGATLEKKRLRDEEQRQAERLAQALREAEQQKRMADEMLRNILPDEIAKELLAKGSVDPRYFEDVTIGFTDFEGFTLSTEQIAADDLVVSLNEYFTAFDRIIQRYGLEKMKTIGDSYMFAGGLPVRSPSHPVDTVLASFELLRAAEEIGRRPGMPAWKMRIGLHTGPVIAGVVGIKKFAFDVWGSSVNFASRMESSGAAGCINISEQTFGRIRDFIRCEPRGKVATKDKVMVDMYFALEVLPDLLQPGPEGEPAKFLRRYRIYFQKAPKSFPAFVRANEQPSQ